MTLPTNESNCDRPPSGWVCTRGAGHDGLCAAVSEIDYNGAAAIELAKERAEAVALLRRIVNPGEASRSDALAAARKWLAEVQK